MLLIKFFSSLPASVVYVFFRAIGGLAYYVFRYRRSVVHDNIKKTFPDFDEEKLKAVEKRFYFQFTEVLAEMILSYRFKKEDWEKRCKLLNPELLRSHLDKGEPIVLLSGHTANWEWPAHSISSQIGYPMEFMYKPLKNKKIEDIVHRLRTRHGGTPIPKDEATREILKRKDVPRIIGILGDQMPSWVPEKIWVDFLNRETPFYMGAERIAVSMKYPVYFSDAVRKGRGNYEVTFKPIAQPPFSEKPDVILKYVEHLEIAIRRNPPDYLWSHRRWKYTREQYEAHRQL